jgi:hypothetical protein
MDARAQNGGLVMGFAIFLIVVAIACIVWLVRTPLVRQHLRGHGRDPGDAAYRVEGRFNVLGGSNNRSDFKRP